MVILLDGFFARLAPICEENSPKLLLSIVTDECCVSPSIVIDDIMLPLFLHLLMVLFISCHRFLVFVLYSSFFLWQYKIPAVHFNLLKWFLYCLYLAIISSVTPFFKVS